MEPKTLSLLARLRAGQNVAGEAVEGSGGVEPTRDSGGGFGPDGMEERADVGGGGGVDTAVVTVAETETLPVVGCTFNASLFDVMTLLLEVDNGVAGTVRIRAESCCLGY